MRIVERDFFAFRFQDGSGLPVDQQQIIGLKTAAHGGFSDGNRRHAGRIFVTIDDLPTGILELAINPLTCTFFGFQSAHDALPSCRFCTLKYL